ncbi:MAG: hypothetical protein E3K37_01385 [Candidatus Kuenenia sp.]|nr:hypothetical protein [Candidatus Kuenenia hertensis]
MDKVQITEKVTSRKLLISIAGMAAITVVTLYYLTLPEAMRLETREIVHEAFYAIGFITCSGIGAQFWLDKKKGP